MRDVFIDARDTGVGDSRLAANRSLPAWQLAAVIMTTDGRGHDVPAALGSTGPDGERGREAEAVTAKVALIRRYREVVADPWPTPQSNG